MNKKERFLIVLPLVTVTGAVQNVIAQQNNDQKKKPLNIIYIMSDDHSYQTISCYDKRYIHTPNIDRLADEGVRFTNSFVTNSISGPSRAVMLTGKFSHKNGKLDNKNDFNGSQQTFPKLLQQAGYQTAIFGKWHLGSEPTGFDRWEVLPGQGQYYRPTFITPRGNVDYEGYATTVTTDLSINWMDRERDPAKPFCLIIHHKAPHRNWMADTAELPLFEDVTFPLPETFWDNYNGRPAAAAQNMSIDKDMDIFFDLKMNDPEFDTPLKSRYSLGRLNKEQRQAWDSTYLPILRDFKAANLSGEELVQWKFQRYMRDYLKCIKSLDDNIGRMLDYLKEHDMLDNTIIVYTSDQGFYMGEHGWFDKRFMYEESFRTPLVMRLPESLGKRGDINELVQNIDYAPTFLELAGVEVPDDMQGESLVPILKGENPKNWRKSIYYHYYEHPSEHSVRMHYGVRNDRYKLIRYYGHDIDCWELFDLKNDPHELDNVYEKEEYSDIRRLMHIELEKLQTQYEDNNV